MQTIDIDHKILENFPIEHITTRILKCKHIQQMEIRTSPSLNGYHIRIICNLDCEACRLAFDDDYRFTADYTNRKKHQKNVLFTQKPYTKTGKTITLKAGEWERIK
jgi:hypothetical protein